MQLAFGQLSEAFRNNDLQSYSDLLEGSSFALSSLESEYSLNIFHEMSSSILNEKYILPFLEKTVQVVITKLSSEVCLSLINAQHEIEEKYSPLHLSILRGSLKLAKRLLDLGADPFVKTNLGRNALHLCAEADLFGLFLHIKDEFGLSLADVDKKGFTPLHVAIGERREDMALLVLSLCKGVDLDVSLALDMAVNTGSYKITRQLLLYRRENHLELKPLNRSSDDKDIAKLLKRPKSYKSSQKYFWLLKCGLFAKYASLVYEIFVSGLAIADSQSILITVFRVLGFFTVLTLLIVLNKKNPGFETKDLSTNLTVRAKQDLYSKYIPEFICPYCELKKHRGTKHCNWCKKCVREFDHHCKWINNCVGRDNLMIFIGFMVSIIANLVSELGYFVYAGFVVKEVNWVHIGSEFRSGNPIDYLSIFGIFINCAMLGFTVPVAVEVGIRINKSKHNLRRVDIEPVLSRRKYFKGCGDLENESTSDTASMLVREIYDSNIESATSSAVISQFFSDR